MNLIKKDRIKFFVKKLRDFAIGSNKKLKEQTNNFFGVNENRIIDNQIKSNRNNLKYLIIGFSLIIIVIVVKDLFKNQPYEFNNDGSVSKILREDINKDESYDLNVSGEKNNTDVRINFYSDDSNSERKNERQKTFDEYISETVSNIESSNEEKIALPSELENKEKIKWKINKDKSIFYVFVLGIVLLILLCINKDQKIKKEKLKAINQVKKELPGLINKIILIWKSGKTFEDAVKESIMKLEERGEEEYFNNNLKNILNRSLGEGENIVFLINKFAINTKVKDFIRIANIMVENQYKGSFLLDKLQMEREILWINRKKTAIEEGKKAETKLVIPMAILLISLILVTAAPAFIQM